MNTILKTDVGDDRRPQALRSTTTTNTRRGELSLCLDGLSDRDDGVTRPPPPPRQRVKPEAEEEIARRNAGTCAAAAMAGRLAGDRVCDVRASGAGRDNYEASTCGSVGALFSTYGQSADNRRPPSRQQGPGNAVSYTHLTLPTILRV